MTKSSFIACEEVVGKTIQALRIYGDLGEGSEVQIDFPDGTSFTCSVSIKPAVEACLIRPGVGEPEELCRYVLD